MARLRWEEKMAMKVEAGTGFPVWVWAVVGRRLALGDDFVAVVGEGVRSDPRRRMEGL